MVDETLGGDAARILMPLPDRDFDPTEAAIPWKACISRGWRVAVSTESGKIPEADGHKLAGPLPGLLSAGAVARAAYREMTQDSDYRHPIPYADIDSTRYEALLLPGGDAPRMRQYLESPILRGKVLQFCQQSKPVGAICHGILVLARTVDPQTGRSVLFGHKLTVLPKSLDRAAYLFDSWLLRRGYVMYPRCVAEEVQGCLKDPDDLSHGPGFLTPHVVCDGTLITARWYGDADLFAERFADEVQRWMSARRAEAGLPSKPLGRPAPQS